MQGDKIKHIKGLDVLRAFAVIFVIITHWGPHKFQSDLLTFIFTRLMPDGNFGVDLFFVLSGYLITRILLQARSDDATHRWTIIKAFYVRRSLRIFPIYYLLTIALFFLYNSDVREHLVYFLTYTANILVFNTQSWLSYSHTWSLAVEEQFYLLWPWVIIFSPKKHLFKIITAWLAIGILSSVLSEAYYGSFFYVLTFPCITAFAIGGMYAYAGFNDRIKKQLVRIILILLPISILLFFVNQFDYKLTLIRLVNSIIAINLIHYVVREKYNAFCRFILNNNILIYLGKISYGIYLYHYVLPHLYVTGIMQLAKQFNFNERTIAFLTYPPPAYIIELALVIVVAHLSYNLLEIKAIRLKKYFNYTNSTSLKEPA